MSQWKSIFHERINELFAKEKDRDYKITYEDYATKLKTTRSSLRGWLAGVGEPKSEKLREIAEIENVSVNWLVGFEDTSKVRLTPLPSDSKDQKRFQIEVDEAIEIDQEILQAVAEQLPNLSEEEKKIILPLLQGGMKALKEQKD